MHKLKPITIDAVPAALVKAERYRLIGDPSGAESICLDVLAVDPANQQAVSTLLLAITDQFDQGVSASRARALLPRLQGEYEKHYYAGIIAERTAHAQLRRRSPNSSFTAYDGFRFAMECYAKAEAVRPAGNDDAILRWNTCARVLMSNQTLRPRPDEAFEPVLGE